jgi:hypothetical protein
MLTELLRDVASVAESWSWRSADLTTLNVWWQQLFSVPECSDQLTVSSKYRIYRCAVLWKRLRTFCVSLQIPTSLSALHVSLCCVSLHCQHFMCLSAVSLHCQNFMCLSAVSHFTVSTSCVSLFCPLYMCLSPHSLAEPPFAQSTSLLCHRCEEYIPISWWSLPHYCAPIPVPWHIMHLFSNWTAWVCTCMGTFL